MLLKLTGLTDEKARFQVISIITGTGFTTKESELITQHKIRRKFAQNIMIVGYIGWGTIISFTATIINDIITRTFSAIDVAVILIISTIIIYILKHQKVILFLDNIIEKIILSGRSMDFQKKEVYKLLNRKHGYGIYCILIDKASFLVGKSIKNSSIKNYEIQVLSIDKGDEYIAFPDPDYIFEDGDNIIVYGKVDSIMRILRKNI